MPDVRSVLERAERAVSNVPLPPGGLERLHHRRDRRRRNQRLAAGVVGIAVFVAAVWIVMTGGPFDDAGAPVVPGEGRTTGPTGTPPHPAGFGLMGLPPEGATPSAPMRGDLVLSFTFGHTGGDPGRFGLSVYADGRVIWQRLGDLEQGRSSTGLIEQRLTPEGVDLVVAEVQSTGLVHSGPTPRWDSRVLVGPLGGLHYGWIEVRTDRLHRLSWGDPGASDGVRPVELEVRPEDVATLEGLDARLEDLASWLPASAWEDRTMRMYVPSGYSVCYSGRDEPIERGRILDLLPQPAADLLQGSATTSDEFHGPVGPIRYWCSVVTAEQARVLAGVIEDAPESSRLSLDGPVYSFSPRDRSRGEISVMFEALLPHDVT